MRGIINACSHQKMGLVYRAVAGGRDLRNPPRNSNSMGHLVGA